MFSRFAIWIIKNLWRKRFGRYYNRRYKIICRFYPTCSEYATLALEKYGLVKGIFMAKNRVKRCRADNTDSCYDIP